MGDRVKKRGMLISLDKNELIDRQTNKKNYYVKFEIGFIVEQTENHIGLDRQDFTGSEKLFEVLKEYYGVESDFVVEFVEQYDSKLQKKITKKKIVQVDDVEIG